MTALTAVLLLAALPGPGPAPTDDPPAAESVASKPVSFLDDIAPIFVRSCIGCHNPRKAEGKYQMTTFAALAKGGQNGLDITLEPGKPDESYLVEVIRPDASPRMPYKLDPLPPDQIALIERWVAEGGKFDGPEAARDADWLTLLRRRHPAPAPESYPRPMPITALAFSPDGSRLVASGYRELTVWSTADGTLTGRVPGLDDRTFAIAFSPDGALLAAAGGDPGQLGTVRLFDARPDGTFGPPRTVVEASDTVLAAAFSPDGATLATAGADRTIRLTRIPSGETIASIEDHADWVVDLAFSPDGKRLATASRDKTAKVFDVAAREAVTTFPGHNDAVHAVSWSKDGSRVRSGGGDGRVRSWDPDEEAKQTGQVEGFEGGVFRLLALPGGDEMAACGPDPVVRLLAPDKVRAKLEGHADWVHALAVSRDGKILASGDHAGVVRLWSLPGGEPRRDLVAAPGFVNTKE
jgi:dipeptidyl aminopeptidase/acylaminoacyl peptidase